jgi:hypothetical protein
MTIIEDLNGGEPERFYLDPKTATFEDLLDFFRALTGRESWAENVEETRAMWAELQASLRGDDSPRADEPADCPRGNHESVGCCRRAGFPRRHGGRFFDGDTHTPRHCWRPGKMRITPAMAAKATDRFWTFADLIAEMEKTQVF